jgi:hypothetical protein
MDPMPLADPVGQDLAQLTSLQGVACGDFERPRNSASTEHGIDEADAVAHDSADHHLDFVALAVAVEGPSRIRILVASSVDHGVVSRELLRVARLSDGSQVSRRSADEGPGPADLARQETGVGELSDMKDDVEAFVDDSRWRVGNHRFDFQIRLAV